MWGPALGRGCNHWLKGSVHKAAGCGIPSGPRTSSSSQMGRARFRGGWLWPKVSSVSLLADWASSWHSWLQLLGCPKASTGLRWVGLNPGVAGWGVQHTLKLLLTWAGGLGPRHPGACASLLVYWLGPDKSGCGAAVVLGLVPTCWWLKPGPRASAGHWRVDQILGSLATGTRCLRVSVRRLMSGIKAKVLLELVLLHGGQGWAAGSLTTVSRMCWSWKSCFNNYFSFHLSIAFYFPACF